MLKKSAKQQQQKRRAIDFFQAPPYRVSYAGLHVLHLYPTLPRPLTCPIPRSLPSSLPLLIVDIVGPKETLSWGCVSPQQWQHSSGFSSRCLCKFTTAARMMPHSSACCCTFILAIPRLDSWCWCWDLLPAWETIRMSWAKAVRLTVGLLEGVSEEGARGKCKTDSQKGRREGNEHGQS